MKQVIQCCVGVTMVMFSKRTNTAKKHSFCFNLARINVICRAMSYSVTGENKLVTPSQVLFSDWRE